MNDIFNDIRPYNDGEVKEAITRLLKDDECIDAITALRFKNKPLWFKRMLRPIVRMVLKRQLAHVDTVHKQQLVVETYLGRVIDDTTSKLTVSGIDQLCPSKAYLFVSNHRDIAVDPAMVNWQLHQHHFQTLRIAIGDNLLTKPFVEDLMRLNKSFIVNRSASKPREKLKAAKHLSSYIYHSVVNDNANVWIAQREGRAKDGIDKTNSAVISMLSLCRPKEQDLSDFIKELNIVPVSISYEWDPCAEMKARELFLKSNEGNYKKAEHEDAQSIARGITGFKGHVHVAFGAPLSGDYSSSEDVAQDLDQQIIANYHLHSSNYLAYEAQGYDLKVPISPEQRKAWDDYLNQVHPDYKDTLIAMYANPVLQKKNTSA